MSELEIGTDHGTGMEAVLGSLIGTLTDEQKEAAFTLDRPVTLMAAAGSGKTTVLVQRYLALLDQGHSPRQILTVTFTTEAAKELKSRIRSRLEERGAHPDTVAAVENTPYIGTLHSFCYTLLDHYGSVLHLKPIARIVDSFELATEFDRAYRRWLESVPAIDLKRALGYFTHAELRTVARELYDQRYLFRQSLRRLPENDSSVEPELLQFLGRLLEPLFSALEGLFLGQGAYSFDDLEQLALRLLQASPEVEKRLQGEITHCLVDEFQDTSQIQWQILRHVLGDRMDRLFVVGDPKQSIYSFRHADVRLFLEIGESLRASGGSTLELSTNFRSSARLLEAINHVGRSIFARSEVPFAPMLSGRDTEADQDPISSSSSLVVHRYESGSHRSELFRREAAEAATVVRGLLERGAAPHHIALLFRVSDRIPDYFRALSVRGIPVVCKQSTRLMECYDVVDLVSYLKTVHNPLDDFALAGFLSSSFVGASRRTLWELFERPGDSLFEKLLAARAGTLATSLPPLDWFVSLIESGTFGLDAVLESLFANAGYRPVQFEAVLRFLGPLLQEDKKGLNVSEAIEHITSWEKEDLLFSSEQREGDEQAVSLMTVHAAKGLEFPHVCLVDNLRAMPRRTPPVRLHPEHAPGIRFRRDGETVANRCYEEIAERQLQSDVEESRRILYVALTRPRQSLHIFLPKDAKLIPKGTWGEWLVNALGDPTDNLPGRERKDT